MEKIQGCCFYLMQQARTTLCMQESRVPFQHFKVPQSITSTDLEVVPEQHQVWPQTTAEHSPVLCALLVCVLLATDVTWP